MLYLSMEYKIGDVFYLKGTKQRFVLVDRVLSANFYLVKYIDKNRAYLSYMQKSVTKEELFENYILTSSQ